MIGLPAVGPSFLKAFNTSTREITCAEVNSGNAGMPEPSRPCEIERNKSSSEAMLFSVDTK